MAEAIESLTIGIYLGVCHHTAASTLAQSPRFMYSHNSGLYFPKNGAKMKTRRILAICIAALAIPGGMALARLGQSWLWATVPFVLLAIFWFYLVIVRPPRLFRS